jgi:hypothetical protein
MPFFKTTHNIFKDYGEHFNANWMDSDKLVLPPTADWDYSRELTIEDVDIWELIHESSVGIYAAWCPYAEFYLLRPFWQLEEDGYKIETFYGRNAAGRVRKRAKDFGIELHVTEIWVDDEVAPRLFY